MIQQLPAWVSWITTRGIYGYTHRVVKWTDGVPVKTACGKTVQPTWRESRLGVRCAVCHKLYGGWS